MSVEDRLVHLFAVAGVETRRAGEDKHVREGWVGVRCPFCGTDAFHMGVNVRYLNAHCWGCGGRSLYDLIKAIDRGIPWDEAKAIRADLDLIPKRSDNNAAAPGRYKPPPGLQPELCARHIQYLRQRGIGSDADYFKSWGMSSIDWTGGRYKYRIFLPVTLGREVVSFTTRAQVDVGLRYIAADASMEAVPHKRLLFGEDFVKSTCLVLEGPLDAVAVGHGAVATFGIDVTPAQVTRIGRYPKRGVCFDNEPNARRRAEELVNRLSTLPGKTWLIELDSKDPGTATQRERARLRRFIDG